MNLLEKSIKVLRSLQLPNGGILATPKNGAYPYVYIRDGVIMTKALNRVGLCKNSEKFYYFIHKFSKIERYKELFHRYNPTGLPSVTRESQNDNAGLMLHGIYDTYLYCKKKVFLQHMWPFIEKIVGLIFSFSKTGLVKTKTSIHEFKKLENGYEIWANCACARGLYDAAEIAKILNYEKYQRKWKEKAQDLEKNIHKKLFNKKTGLYMKNTKFPNVIDISQLSPFYFGLDKSEKNLRKSLNHIWNHLWYGEIGGFRRFRKFEIVKNWHWYTGGSGGWLIYTSWGAKLFKKIKDKKRFEECIKVIKRISKKYNGLLPEHIALKEEYEEWKKKEIEFNIRIINEMDKIEKSIKKMDDEQIVWWATPLGWSHAEYILLKKT